MKKLAILGASGSIGRQTLDLLKNNKIEYELIGVSIGKNIEVLQEILNNFSSIKYAYLIDEKAKDELSIKYKNIEFFCADKIQDFIQECNADMYVNALVGFVGVIPSFKVIEMNKNLALANKETLVCGGKLFIKKLKKSKSKLFPIDSEHVAIEKCLKGNRKNLKTIILTCSGGPFCDYSYEQLQTVSKDDALKHPTWKMGNKISIDSATLINKVFEIAEAFYLFNYSKIKVLIHKESLVHSLIELNDGNYLLDLGINDMQIPISYALKNNKRININKSLDIYPISNLTFKEPNQFQKEILELGYSIIKKGGNLGTIINAANDFAVEKFLNGEIKFLDIYKIITYAIDNTKYIKNISLHDIISTNDFVKDLLKNYFDKRGQ